MLSVRQTISDRRGQKEFFPRLCGKPLESAKSQRYGIVLRGLSVMLSVAKRYLLAVLVFDALESETALADRVVMTWRDASRPRSAKICGGGVIQKNRTLLGIFRSFLDLAFVSPIANPGGADTGADRLWLASVVGIEKEKAPPTHTANRFCTSASRPDPISKLDF